MRYEIRCYEHPHRFPKNPAQEAENAKLRELKPPGWPPVVVTARGWDNAKAAARAEIEKRGRRIRGIHIEARDGAPVGIRAIVFTETDSQIRDLTIQRSRYGRKV